MSDPLDCLRRTTIAIALWQILYALIQIAIFGWQVKYTKDRQWEFENRQLVADGAIDGFQARFPGLYGIYTESPERRRINALFALAIVILIASLAHLILSFFLLFGAIKNNPNYILAWFFTAFPSIVLSTGYSVVWWSGDIFGTQLTMSVAEFIMSLAINSVCFVIVLFFFLRLKGQLKSAKASGKNDFLNFHKQPSTVPPWRHQAIGEPPAELVRKLRRSNRHHSKNLQRAHCHTGSRYLPPNVSTRSKYTGLLGEERLQRNIGLTNERLAEHNRAYSLAYRPVN